MLYDRPYMRSDYRRREISVVAWVIIATIGAYLIQQIARTSATVGGPTLLEQYLSVSGPTLKLGFVWTLVTYGFLHGGILHILFNLLCVYFLGREILNLVGPQRFLGLYLGSLVLGGLAAAAVQLLTGNGALVMGASGAVFSLLVVYACFQPDRPVTLLLFFILPVTVRPRYLAWGALAISLIGLVTLEIPSQQGSMVAHSAHLGGMLAGWLYFRFVHERTGEYGRLRPSIELPSWLRKRRTPPQTYSVNVSPPTDVKAEVDRILDKINSQGFGALTEDERRLLDNARETLSRR